MGAEGVRRVGVAGLRGVGLGKGVTVMGLGEGVQRNGC